MASPVTCNVSVDPVVNRTAADRNTATIKLRDRTTIRPLRRRTANNCCPTVCHQSADERSASTSRCYPRADPVEPSALPTETLPRLNHAIASPYAYTLSLNCRERAAVSQKYHHISVMASPVTCSVFVDPVVTRTAADSDTATIKLRDCTTIRPLRLRTTNSCCPTACHQSADERSTSTGRCCSRPRLPSVNALEAARL